MNILVNPREHMQECICGIYPQIRIGPDLSLMSIPCMWDSKIGPSLGRCSPFESESKYHGLWLHENCIIQVKENNPQKEDGHFLYTRDSQPQHNWPLGQHHSLLSHKNVSCGIELSPTENHRENNKFPRQGIFVAKDKAYWTWNEKIHLEVVHFA